MALWNEKQAGALGAGGSRQDGAPASIAQRVGGRRGLSAAVAPLVLVLLAALAISATVTSQKNAQLPIADSSPATPRPQIERVIRAARTGPIVTASTASRTVTRATLRLGITTPLAATAAGARSRIRLIGVSLAARPPGGRLPPPPKPAAPKPSAPKPPPPKTAAPKPPAPTAPPPTANPTPPPPPAEPAAPSTPPPPAAPAVPSAPPPPVSPPTAVPVPIDHSVDDDSDGDDSDDSDDSDTVDPPRSDRDNRGHGGSGSSDDAPRTTRGGPTVDHVAKASRTTRGASRA